MRIAIPVALGQITDSLARADGFRVYEDDHGKLVRRLELPRAAFDDAVALLEDIGADALLCGALDEAERRAVSLAGVMCFDSYRGEPEDAVHAFLSGAVASDPSNTCRACEIR